jgi:hypothetical protein
MKCHLPRSDRFGAVRCRYAKYKPQSFWPARCVIAAQRVIADGPTPNGLRS